MAKKKADPKRTAAIKNLIAKGRIAEALKKAHAEDADVLMDIGRSLAKEGNHKTAQRVFHRVLQISPTNPNAWYKQGTSLLRLGKYNEALKCLDRAIKWKPKYAEAWHNKGVVQGELGKLNEALKCFDQAIKIHPKDADAWHNKGVALAKLGKLYEAFKCYDQAIKIDPKDAAIWGNKGATLGNLGKLNEALKCFDQAIKIDPKDASAWHNKAVALASLGELYEALKCYDQAIKIDPKDAAIWRNKGGTLGELGKLNEALKCYDQAIKIDPKDAGAWLNKGIALGKLGKLNHALKCYEQAIKIDPKYTAAWDNKGVTLAQLGKPQKALKSFGQAIKIDPKDAAVWNNKGGVLGSLGEHREALKCFDQAIDTNPNYAWAYPNRGTALLNLHKYDESAAELTKAKELLSEQGLKTAAERAMKLRSLALNASKLLKKLEPLDAKLMDCLTSASLAELDQKCLAICQAMEGVIKKFQKTEIPKDARQLLVSKVICVRTLSHALRFRKVDLRTLAKAKKVFQMWGLDTLLKAADDIDSFARLLKKYKRLDEIPEEKETFLLRALSTSYVFDGKLTQEISGKIKAEPFPPEPAGLEKEPLIEQVIVPDIVKDSWIRVCLVQMAFPLTKTFPYQLQRKEDVRGKMLNALYTAQQEKANVICFPELSFAKEFVEEVKKYDDMLIVGGTFYDDQYFNVCPVIVGGQDYRVRKIHPSPHFEAEIIKGKGMKRGKEIKIFRTVDDKLRFSVLICLDYIVESNRVCRHGRDKGKGVNLIFNPCHNPQPSRCQAVADVNCENFHVDTVQANLAESGNKYGKSCIIGLEHTDTLNCLLTEGVKPNDDIKYKLCQATAESMLIVDLCLEPVKLSTPPDAMPRIKIIAQYEYKKKRWRK